MSDKPIKEIVKKEKWQKTRERLVGQWMENPTKCCSILRDYLGSIKGCDYDDLRIVMNYLTGTAFRIGKIKHDCVQKLRTEISIEMKKRKAFKKEN